MSWEIQAGECRELLQEVHSGSVQCVVTSPPYYGLRDYKLEPSVWGGELECDHEWDTEVVHGEMRRGLGLADSPASTRGGGKKVAETPDVAVERATCALCGAWRGTLGNEPTVQMYVAHMVEVFAEVKRVLRDDGVVWLNLGDSYANPGHYKGNPGSHGTIGRPRATDHEEGTQIDRSEKGGDGLKNKDLIGVPWRVAFALQEDGWYLRSEVIWAKPNPLPESVRDRPTKAHEQVFLLTKSPRYFYDAHAIREENVSLDPDSPSHRESLNGEVGERLTFDQKYDQEGRRPEGRNGAFRYLSPFGRNKRSVWEIPTVPFKGAHFAVFPPALVEPCVEAGSSERGRCPECWAPWHRATLRSRQIDGEDVGGGWEQDDAGRIGAQGVGHWRITTNSTTLGWYPSCACGAPEGVEPGDLEPILTPTGSRAGDDPSMETGRAGLNRPRGEGGGTRTMTRYEQRKYAEQLRELEVADHEHRTIWKVVKVAETPLPPDLEVTREAWKHYIRVDRAGGRPAPQGLLDWLIELGVIERVEPPSWEPPEPEPCLVLDPFSGAGTTGLVALRKERSFLGLELSEEFAGMARRRIRDDAPLLNGAAELAS